MIKDREVFTIQQTNRAGLILRVFSCNLQNSQKESSVPVKGAEFGI